MLAQSLATACFSAITDIFAQYWRISVIVSLNNNQHSKAAASGSAIKIVKP